MSRIAIYTYFLRPEYIITVTFSHIGPGTRGPSPGPMDWSHVSFFICVNQYIYYT
jgi:hypothetical protein